MEAPPTPTATNDDDLLTSNHSTTSDNEDVEEEECCWASYGRRSPGLRFPPPIPLLARTGNLTSHMPWVLKRTYKPDGSLVLHEVPVRHHEFFRARRRDGRLTLHLVEASPPPPMPPAPPRRTKCTEKAKEVDLPARQTPRFALSVLPTLSSSLPEPTFQSKKCSGDDESPIRQVSMLSRLKSFDDQRFFDNNDEKDSSSSPPVPMIRLKASKDHFNWKGCFEGESSMPVSRLNRLKIS